MAEGTSSTKKGILIGCGIALAVMVCGFGGCMAFCGGSAWYLVEQTEAPAHEARAFLNALSKGDIKDAQSHMSAGYKSRLSADQLSRFTAQDASLQGIRDITFSQRALNGQGASLGGPVTTATGVTMVQLELVEEGKAWRVERAVISGQPLEDDFHDAPPPSRGAPPPPPPPPRPPAPPSSPAPGK